MNATSIQLRERQLETTGGSLVLFEAGSGPPVLILTGSRSDSWAVDSLAAGEAVVATSKSSSKKALALASDLARNWRTILISPAERVDAAALLAGLQKLDLPPLRIMAFGRDANLAIAMAAAAPETTERVVLISPQVAADAALPSLETPVLTIVGSLDRTGAADTARRLRATLPTSNFSIVHGAAEDVVSDRPQAAGRAIEDFLQRGGAYVVYRQSMVLDAE